MSARGGGRYGAGGVIERFLGAEAAAGGLYELLGIDPASLGEDSVIRALEQRLTVVEQHPHGRTPEADEVRLALHAAAAQLLDRSARSGIARAPVKVPRGRASIQSVRLRLEQDAIITLAQYGGWNRRALRRLTMLALARGAKPDDVASVLTHLAHRRRGGSGNALARVRRHRTLPGVRPPVEEPRLVAVPQLDEEVGPDGRPTAIVVGAIATLVTLVVAVSLVVIALTTGGGKPVPEPGTPAEDERVGGAPPELPMAGGEELFPWQGASGAAGPGETAAPESAPAFESLSDALGALDSADEGLSVDPERAVALFDRAFSEVGARWCNLTIDQQRAAQHDVVEFVYRGVQRPELSARVIDAMARGGEVLAREGTGIGSDEIWPAAWSVGMLARLAREQDLGALAARSVEQCLRRQIGSALAVSGGFEQGVQAALWAMLSGMVMPVEDPKGAEGRWERWIDAARLGQGEAQSTVLSALEWVVLAPAEPTDSEPVRDAIEGLTLACEWGEGSATRAWLVRMFADARVSDADLHAITTTLARRSRAPGVDVTMALPVRSDASDREALRERYAGAWGLDIAGPTLDDLASDWMKAAREAGKLASSATTTTERLAAAACLSRVNEAGRLRYSGKLDDAGIVIDEFDRLVETELTSWSQRRSADRLDTDPGMSRWALSYLSAERDFSERLRLLNEARQMQVSEAVDAEVLVTEAVRGSPAQARAAARDAVLAQQPNAVLTLALLEIAPRMPRTAQNAELVSAVTATLTIPADDPDWRLRVRRVLVQTALEQLASEGDQGVIDAMAGLLGESYAARAAGEASGTGGSSAPRLAADQAAAMLRVQWERLARQGGLGSGAIEVEAVLARHAARLGLAQGPVQTFAAEQLAAFELMSVAVASERIERAEEVRAAADAVRDARRSAEDVIGQILAVEGGFVDLWAIRLGQELP